MATPRELILRLNNLGIGDLGVLRTRLGTIRNELVEMGQADLSARMDQAMKALADGEIDEYRRLVNQIVSRLGHVRAS
jgi:hypothetical protein